MKIPCDNKDTKKMRIFLSREFWEFFEVWVSFLQEGVFTLLCLFHEIVHQGGISGEFHQSVLSVQLGI